MHSRNKQSQSFQTIDSGIFSNTEVDASRDTIVLPKILRNERKSVHTRLSRSSSNIKLRNIQSQQNTTQSYKTRSDKEQIASHNVKRLINNLEQSIDVEFAKSISHPLKFADRIQKLEQQKEVEQDIDALKYRVVKQKNYYNSIIFRIGLKKKYFNQLRWEFKMLKGAVFNPKQLKRVIRKRKKELQDLVSGQKNEHYYRKTLLHMKANRKQCVDKLYGPINQLRSDVNKTKGKIEAEKLRGSAISVKTQIYREKQLEIFSQIKINRKLHKNDQSKCMKRYGFKYRFKKYLEHEKSRGKMYIEYQSNSLKLHRLEVRLDKLQDLEAITEKIQTVKKLQKKRAEKFKLISKLTKLSSAQEMDQYYAFLIQTRLNLDVQVKEATNRISTLQQERNQLKQALEKLLKDIYESQEQQALFEKLEQQLISKQIQLEVKEQTLKNTEQIVARILTSVSQLVFQISQGQRTIQLEYNNVDEALTLFQDGLEEIQEIMEQII